MTEAPAPRTLMLGAAVCDGDEAMSGTVGLRIGGEVFTLRVTVPAANVPLAAVLPVLQGLADVVVADAVADKAAAGNPVRCGMRCSACCNQPVPITASEARGLAATVAALPAAARRRTIERALPPRAPPPRRCGRASASSRPPMRSSSASRISHSASPARSSRTACARSAQRGR